MYFFKEISKGDDFGDSKSTSIFAVKFDLGITFHVTSLISLYLISSSATSHPKSVKLIVI